jgi:hypothetical protein
MKKHFNRIIAVMLVLATCFGLLSTFGTIANAAATGDVYMVRLPRSTDPNQAGWGHPALTFANGWHTAASTFATAKAVGICNGDIEKMARKRS